MGGTVGIPASDSYLPEALDPSARSTTKRSWSKSKTKMTVSVDLQVAHFTPSTFPLVPVLKPEYLPLCRKSWQVICSQRQRIEEYGTDIHGITLFYNEFYERLARVDAMGLFEGILVRNAVGTNRIAAKGAILVRIVDFMLKFDGDTHETKLKLKRQGVIHKAFEVRPWQYAVFLEIFVHTMSSRLAEQASEEVMEAWVHLLGYTLRHMLPAAIDGTVLESGAHVNFFKKGGGSATSVASTSTQLTSVKEPWAPPVEPPRNVPADHRARTDPARASMEEHTVVFHRSTDAGDASDADAQGLSTPPETPTCAGPPTAGTAGTSFTAL